MLILLALLGVPAAALLCFALIYRNAYVNED